MLGLDDTIGNFEVGKEFDALLIEPHVTRSKFIVVNDFDTVQVIVLIIFVFFHCYLIGELQLKE